MSDNFQGNPSELLSTRQEPLGLLNLRGHFVADVTLGPVFYRQDWQYIREAYPVTEEHALLVSPARTALVHAPSQEVLWDITCPAEGASALNLPRHLLALGSSQGIFLWDLSTGNVLRRLDVDEDAPTGLAFSADGSLLAVGLYNTGVRVWQVNEGRLLYTLWEPDDSDGFRSVAISPDGQWLASGTHEGWEVWVWRLADGQLAHRLQGPGGRVAGLVCSSDGHLLVCGDGGGGRVEQLIRAWEMPEGRAVQRFPWYAFNPALSPDGRLLAAAGRPSTAGQRNQTGLIFIGDVESRREIQRLAGHTAYVMRLAFSPGGRRLVSCGADLTARWWDVASGQELYRIGTQSIALQ